MELREFVAETLAAILDGVEDAIRTAPEHRQGKIAPVIEGLEDWSKAILPVEFDVAVTEADKASAGGKGGIKLLPAVEIGTISTSPGSSVSIRRASCARSVLAPLTCTSRKTFLHPALVSCRA